MSLLFFVVILIEYVCKRKRETEKESLIKMSTPTKNDSNIVSSGKSARRRLDDSILQLRLSEDSGSVLGEMETLFPFPLPLSLCLSFFTLGSKEGGGGGVSEENICVGEKDAEEKAEAQKREVGSNNLPLLLPQLSNQNRSLPSDVFFLFFLKVRAKICGGMSRRGRGWRRRRQRRRELRGSGGGVAGGSSLPFSLSAGKIGRLWRNE